MVRIALVHFCYAPVIGGVETILAAHARLFAENGHALTVICKRGVSDDPRIHVLLFNEETGMKARLRELLSAFDIVFVHNVLTMPFAPAWTEAIWQAADELPKVRFVSWIHDLAACNLDYSVVEGSLLRKAHPRIKHIAISRHRQRQFEELTGKRCEVIPNGVDPGEMLGLSENIETLAATHQLCGPRLVLLHPARLLRRKNIQLSLRVTHALLQNGNDCCMLITGPPDAQNVEMAQHADVLRRLRDELDLSRHVLFLHDEFDVSESDLRSLYSLADALFFPSLQEGFGLPVLEAALFRIPIFCADIAPMNGLIKDAVHGFSPNAEPQEIAALIVRTLENSPHFQARKMVYREYAWPIIYEKFLAPLLHAAAFLNSP